MAHGPPPPPHLHAAAQPERQPEPRHAGSERAAPSSLAPSERVAQHPAMTLSEPPSNRAGSSDETPSSPPGHRLDPGCLDFPATDWLPWADNENGDEASPTTPARRLFRAEPDDGETPPRPEAGTSFKMPFGGFRGLGNAGSTGSKVAECASR